MSSIWNTCLSKLENEIPSSDFSTWIRPLQAIESEGLIKLLAPNRFVLDWVKEHYFTKIEEAIHEFSNGTLNLNLEIGSKSSTTINTIKIAKTVDGKKATPNFLNKAFTFDNFVEGKSNQLARAASLQVSENIGKAYNPLLIYGSSGLGKTHMMHAIGNAVLEKKPSATVV
ncbi:MAG: DnaA/Hda family protein, partial [Methylobacter sp.]